MKFVYNWPYPCQNSYYVYLQAILLQRSILLLYLFHQRQNQYYMYLKC